MKEYTTYPDKEKISKNKYTATCYRNIREIFRQNYVKDPFDKPLWPREHEFLQWVKKYLNNLEYNLTKGKK